MTFEPLQPVDDPEPPPRPRRRRANRMLTQMRADEREAYLEELAHQVSPGIDLYLFAGAAGLFIGLALRFDPLALLVAGGGGARAVAAGYAGLNLVDFIVLVAGPPLRGPALARSGAMDPIHIASGAYELFLPAA